MEGLPQQAHPYKTKWNGYTKATQGVTLPVPEFPPASMGVSPIWTIRVPFLLGVAFL